MKPVYRYQVLIHILYNLKKLEKHGCVDVYRCKEQLLCNVTLVVYETNEGKSLNPRRLLLGVFGVYSHVST